MADDPHRKTTKRRLLAAVHGAFELTFVAIVLLFFVSAVTLIWFSGEQLWEVFQPAEGRSASARFVSILECIGLLTIAVAALELAQTILEEEVQRSVAMSAPTRVRRFLSRFLMVVIVSLTIECLVAVFRAIHDAPERLPQAAAIGIAAAALLAAWGVFVRMNTAAEELEPEAIEEAKAEDDKVENRETQPFRRDRSEGDPGGGRRPRRHGGRPRHDMAGSEGERRDPTGDSRRGPPRRDDDSR
ncbi:MAG: hypothetical protein ABWZ78_17545 [Burkholderiaceae bacterium]